MAKEKDYFYQMQGLTSFFKAKCDWLGYERIHLSFVKHDGKQNGCKQVASIEGAIKLHGKDGALYLSDMVLSGGARKLAEKSRAAANGGYPAPFFAVMGGTPASRTANGQCMFRQFTVAPGSKSDYVCTMETCVGEETATGAIQPVKGAQRERIFVSMSSGDLYDFARSIQIEVTAYRTAQMLGTAPAVSRAESVGDVPEQSEPAPVVQSTSLPATVIVMYDTSGAVNQGVPFVVPADQAVATLRNTIRYLSETPAQYACDGESYKAAVKAIQSGEKGTANVRVVEKNNPKQTAFIVVVVTTLTPPAFGPTN